MKQEIWTQMCPMSTYLLPWSDCCAVAVYGQTKARKPRGFMPVTRFIRFLAPGRMTFQVLIRFYDLCRPNGFFRGIIQS